MSGGSKCLVLTWFGQNFIQVGRVFILVCLFVLLFSVKGNELLVILQRNLEIRIEFSINLA